MTPEQLASPSRHHVFWEAKSYRTKHERKFRQFGGFIITLGFGQHRYLHTIVDPPPKPTKAQMYDIMDYVDVVPDQEIASDPLWAVRAAVRCLSDEYNDHREERIATQVQNLYQQIGLMEGGFYVRQRNTR